MSKAIIDLTYPLEASMLVFPGAERPTFSWKGRANSEGYNLTWMSMIVHTGTHVDSPLHFLADGDPIDQVPLSRFYGETRVFRVKTGANAKEFGPDDIEPSIDGLGTGEIFVIDTGIGAYADTARYNSRFSWPSIELAELLVQKKIRCYMTDATAVDPVGSPDSPVHKTLFREGIPIVENLANLAELPDEGNFTISAVPLKLAGREGAPCRAFAIL